MSDLLLGFLVGVAVTVLFGRRFVAKPFDNNYRKTQDSLTRFSSDVDEIILDEVVKFEHAAHYWSNPERNPNKDFVEALKILRESNPESCRKFKTIVFGSEAFRVLASHPQIRLQKDYMLNPDNLEYKDVDKWLCAKDIANWWGVDSVIIDDCGLLAPCDVIIGYD